MRKTLTHKLFTIFAIAFCSIMVLASCSKGASISSTIPDDAAFVATANITNIWEKGDLKNSDNVAFIKLLRQELKKEMPELSELVDKLIADPSSCGLNLKSDIAAFSAKTIGADFVVSALVRDAGKVGNFLRDISDNSDLKMSISKEDKYYLAFCDKGDFLVCWDKKKAYLMMLSSSDNLNEAKDYANRIMSLGDSRTMAANDNFNKYLKSHADAGLFTNLENLMEMRSAFTDIPEKYAEDLKNASFYVSLNFNKGDINVLYKTLGLDNKELAKIADNKFNADLINYMQEKTLAGATFSVNVDALVAEMEKMQDGKELDDKIIKDITLREILKSFNGSFAANISDLVETKNSIMPTFTFAADLSKNSVMKKVLDGMVGDILERKGNNYYIKGVDIYIALSDKVMLVTNDQAALNTFPNGNKNGMAQIAKAAKDGNYIYLDLGVDKYPAFITNKIGSQNIQLLKGFIKYAELKTIDKNSGELVIHLAEDKQNSLAFIIHYFDDNMMQLGELANKL